MIHKIHANDPPGLAKYNFAGLFVSIAVEDAVVALEPLPGIATRVSDELTAWVKQQDYATQILLRRKRALISDLLAPQQEAIEAIIGVQRRAEDRALYATSTAILMAIIHLESTINVFLHHNFGQVAGDAAEPLPYAKKFALAYGLRQVPMPSTINVAIGELVTWRNNFAHGKPTLRPKSLQQTLPPRALTAVPSPREAATEMLHLLRGFLLVAQGLITLNTSPEFIPVRDIYDTVTGHLERCASTIKE